MIASEKAEQICDTFGFRFVRRLQNGGASAARNTGIHESNGEYLRFVDCDDFLPDDSLESLMRPLCDQIQSPWIAGETVHTPKWLSSGMYTKLTKLKLNSVVCSPYKAIPPEQVPAIDPHKVRWHHCAILYRRELFDRYGGYDERLSVSEDKELRWRFWYFSQTTPIHTPNIVYAMRGGRRSDRLTLSGGDKKKWLSIVEEKVNGEKSLSSRGSSVL
jgi:glycosyltransferase involved in cell wall biosynthesis